MRVRVIEVELREEPTHSGGLRRFWVDKETSERPLPGDAYWQNMCHPPARGCFYWDNCNDPRGHLFVVLPDGSHWEVQSRANNCTRRDDRTHRCWVLHETPEGFHVDKSGDTCAAGAGSIYTAEWHGFLQNGELRGC